MARASIPTLLSIDRFARILGVNPVHFNGGSGASVWTRNGACDETWVQYPWQTVRTISREELAREIRGSENEIARYLGWDISPTWHLAEEHQWPSSLFRDYNRLHYDSRGNQPGLHLSRVKLIAGGRRAWSYIEKSAGIIYSDDDGDGYNETATITSATALTDTSEIKLYFDASHNGNPSFEVRPLKSITLTGGNVVIVCDAWLLFKRSLVEASPTGTEMQDINIDVAGNYETAVDILRVYNDTTQVSSQLRWRSSCLLCSGSGCAACDPAVQNGCLSILDAEKGIVQPKPATYAGGSWTPEAWDAGTRPETIKFWYYSGEIAEDYLAGYTIEQLSDYWAEAIAWLTAARLTRPLCSCQNVMSMVNKMQVDMLLNKRDTGARFIPAESYIHKNPLGFKYGEIRTWLRINEAMQWRGGAI